jgi:hypothetical protein
VTSSNAAHIGSAELAGDKLPPAEASPLWGLVLILGDIAARIEREQASEPVNPAAEENRA